MHNNNLKPMVAALMAAALLLAGAVQAAEDEDVQKRIEKLESELTELKGQVSQNSQQAAVTQQDLEEVRVVKKGTKLTYGGYIKLDAMFSNYSEGKPDNQTGIEQFMQPKLIPIENKNPAIDSDSYQSLNVHAQESRFNFGTVTGTDAGVLSSFIEMDFLTSVNGNELVSSSWAVRLRHAFVKWQYGKNSSFLAGQTWSNFMNTAALPDLLDFVGPVGTIFSRQPQIRWTTHGFTVTLENPYTALDDASCNRFQEGEYIPPGQSVGDCKRQYEDDNGKTQADTVSRVNVQTDSEVIPDVILRYDGNFGTLSWAAIAMGRQLAYDKRSNGGNTQASDDTAFGYGLNLSGVWQLGRNDLRFSALYGDALGRFFAIYGFNDGYIDADGNIETFDQYGGFIAYRHFWSDRWRSTFSLSGAWADNPSDAFGDAALNTTVDGWAKEYRSFHMNLNYMPTPAFQLGGELILASREVEDGRSGNLGRLQFSARYAF